MTNRSYNVYVGWTEKHGIKHEHFSGPFNSRDEAIDCQLELNKRYFPHMRFYVKDSRKDSRSVTVSDRHV